MSVDWCDENGLVAPTGSKPAQEVTMTDELVQRVADAATALRRNGAGDHEIARAIIPLVAADAVARLSDHAVVHAGMLRGEIAKLQMHAWAHTHCLTNRDGWLDMTLREADAAIRAGEQP